MTVSTLLFLLAGIALNAGAQLLLKAGVSTVGPIHINADATWATFGRVFVQAPVLAGLMCYVVSVGLWMVALSRVEVSVAYPMLSLGYVFNAVGAWWLFGEALGPARWAGIALILLGVFLISRT